MRIPHDGVRGLEPRCSARPPLENEIETCVVRIFLRNLPLGVECQRIRGQRALRLEQKVSRLLVCEPHDHSHSNNDNWMSVLVHRLNDKEFLSSAIAFKKGAPPSLTLVKVRVE